MQTLLFLLGLSTFIVTILLYKGGSSSKNKHQQNRPKNNYYQKKYNQPVQQPATKYKFDLEEDKVIKSKKTKKIAENKELNVNEVEKVNIDFDIKKAIIYKEILEPKYKEY